MTVSNQKRSIRYQGNDAATEFDYDFFIEETSHVEVIIYNSTNETYTTLTSGQYSITGLNDPGFGAVTYPLVGDPLSTDEYIIINRVAPYVQVMDIPPQGGFYPDVVEAAMDRTTRQIQQIAEIQSRSLFVVEGETFQKRLPLRSLLVDRVLAFDENGDPIAGPTAAEVGNAQGYAEDASAAKTAAETAQAAAEASAAAALAAVPNAFPTTRTILKGYDTSTITAAYLKEAGREGQFLWRTGDYSAEITADINERVFIKADDTAASSGAWVAVGYVHDPVAAPNIIRTVNSKLRDNFDLLDVVDVGDADGIGGGSLDETAYMAEAFEFSYNEGVRLNIGEGVHRLTETIEAADAVHLQGHGNNGFLSTTTARGKGTWLHFDHTGIGLQLGTGAAVERHRLHDIGTIRNQPTPGVGWAPTANEQDIVLRNSGAFIERPFFYNATKALNVIEGGAAQIDIQSPRGQCFREIFRVTETYDVFRVSDAHFWPYFSLDENVIAYQLANLTSFALGRCDNPKIKNFFSIFSRFGVYFEQVTAGKTVRAKFTDTTFDSCNIGVCTDANTDGVTAEFHGLVVQGPNGGGDDGIGALLQGDNAHLVFISPDFAELSKECIRIGGSGNVVRAQAGGRATGWNKSSAGFPVIDCQSGNTANVDGEWTLSGGGSGTLFGGSGNRRYGVKQVGVAAIPNGHASPLTVNMPRNFGMPPKSVQLTFHSGLDTISIYYAEGFNNSQFNIQYNAAPTVDLAVGWVAFYD